MTNVRTADPNAISSHSAASGSLVAVVRFAGYAIVSVCVLFQFIIEPSIENIGCTLLAGLVSVLMIFYTIRSTMFRSLPISILMLIGFNITSVAGALVGQSLLITPLVFNLQSPFTTFLTLSIAHVAVISAHFAYRTLSISMVLIGSVQRLYSRLDLFNQISNAQLWALGIIGSASTWIVSISLYGAVDYGNITLKLFDSLSVFTPAPILISVLHWFQHGRPAASGRQKLFVGLYTIFIIITALARNSRGQFAVYLMMFSIALAIAILSGRLKLNHRQFVSIPLLGLSALVVFLVLSDLSTAMLIVRPERDNLSSSEIISRTFYLMFDRDALAQMRDAISLEVVGMTDYNETYISNPFIERLVITKFHDNMITFLNAFGQEQLDLVSADAMNSFVAIFPTPIIHVFWPDFEKETAAHSSGDFIYYISGGGDEASGRRSGSSVAHGLAIFGYGYYGILALQFFVFSVIFDSLVLKRQDEFGWWSPLALFQLWFFFDSSIFTESVIGWFSVVLRDFPQLVIEYVCLCFLFSTLNARRAR